MVLQACEYKAMILAAGMGTRLRPLTDDRPKALVLWQGRPLLDHVILKLKEEGFTRIIINVHHYAEMIMEHIEKMGHFGIEIVFSHEKDELLDTGGGIAAASWYLRDSPFLVYNVDVDCSINLGALLVAHREHDAIVTMAVKERETSRSLLMDDQNYLRGWRDNRSGETILTKGSDAGLRSIAFSAIHVMNPEIFEYFPREKVFPLMPFYLELAQSRNIYLHRHDEDTWRDLGRLEVFNK